MTEDDSDISWCIISWGDRGRGGWGRGEQGRREGEGGESEGGEGNIMNEYRPIGRVELIAVSVSSCPFYSWLHAIYTLSRIFAIFIQNLVTWKLSCPGLQLIYFSQFSDCHFSVCSAVGILFKTFPQFVCFSILFRGSPLKREFLFDLVTIKLCIQQEKVSSLYQMRIVVTLATGVLFALLVAACLRTHRERTERLSIINQIWRVC